MQRYAIDEMIVTYGAAGAIYHAGRASISYHFPACPVDVKDTIGSGDSFLAAFLSKRIQKGADISIEEAMSFAATLSAFVTQSTGACPSYDACTLNRFEWIQYLERDRCEGGNTNFNPAFITRIVAPRFSEAGAINYRLLVDRNSVEVFADGGLSNLSSLFFIEEPFHLLNFKSLTDVNVQNLYVKVIRAKNAVVIYAEGVVKPLYSCAMIRCEGDNAGWPRLSCQSQYCPCVYRHSAGRGLKRICRCAPDVAQIAAPELPPVRLPTSSKTGLHCIALCRTCGSNPVMAVAYNCRQKDSFNNVRGTELIGQDRCAYNSKSNLPFSKASVLLSKVMIPYIMLVTLQEELFDPVDPRKHHQRIILDGWVGFAPIQCCDVITLVVLTKWPYSLD
ncbi:hypothetical protein FQR65_LT17032 [Abscondita terminalis]|nr:hypothetical protein FQR65_LT17032 [Abscondita terminalis]